MARLLRNPKFQYRVLKSQVLDPVLSQPIIIVHIFQDSASMTLSPFRP
jgi:hypothetical protein